MQSIIEFLDVTHLEEHLEHKTIKLLCTRLNQSEIRPAAVCVYPAHIQELQNCLNGTPIPIATVINFPHGLHEAEQIHDEMMHALSLDAAEMDIVIPYGKWLQHPDPQMLTRFARLCRQWAGPQITLKYILETGALQSASTITTISEILCEQGADFIKSSTGKMVPGATIAAVEAIIQAVKHHYTATGKRVGIKISGGIRTIDQVQEYIQLIRRELGDAWLDPTLFRVGSSRLFEMLV